MYVDVYNMTEKNVIIDLREFLLSPFKWNLINQLYHVYFGKTYFFFKSNEQTIIEFHIQYYNNISYYNFILEYK